MQAATNELGRREFVKRATQAAAAAAVSTGFTSWAATGDQSSEQADPITTRAFGRTKVALPILGFGGAALPKGAGNPLSTEDRVKLVRYAYDRGVRYFDTAGNYQDSQSILGEALHDVRIDVFLVTKVETTVPAEVRTAVEKSLKELQTDYLDAILIHGTPGLEQMTVEEAMAVHAELVKLHEAGIVRSIGLSAHSYFDKALALINSGGFDLCMLSYGYFPRGFNQVLSGKMVALRNACVAKAHELGMGIAAMKVVGGGIFGAWSQYVVPSFDKQRLEQLPAAAIRYVMDDDRVHILVIGMRLETEVDANIKTLSGDVTYTKDDRAILAEFSAGAFDFPAIKAMRVD